MSCHNVHTPCDNWLGLSQYKCSESTSKDLWFNQQYESVQAAIRQALIIIRQNKHRGALRASVSLLEIPVDNLIFLCNHPKGYDKIQDKYKSKEFVMFTNHAEPNAYYIKPVNGKGTIWMVN